MNVVNRKAWKARLLDKIQGPERTSHFPKVPWLARAGIGNRALAFQLSEVTERFVLPSSKSSGNLLNLSDSCFPHV